MGASADIEIALYEPWMLDPLASLRGRHNGLTLEQNRKMIERRFFHPFARERSFIVVARQGENVVGMQSYMYWPYSYGSETFYSVQSGMTLVDGHYRGRGVFSRMLAVGNQVLKNAGVAFVMGFPGQMSFQGFLKDEWSHVATHVSMVRPLRPFKTLASRIGLAEGSGTGGLIDEESGLRRVDQPSFAALAMRRACSENLLHLEASPAFVDYRYPDDSEDYFVYRYSEGQTEILFVCLAPRDARPRVLYLGDILAERESDRSLRRAVRRFAEEARHTTNMNAVVVHIGIGRRRLFRALIESGFLPYGSGRKLVVKPISVGSTEADLIRDNSSWSTMCADRDDWYSSISVLSA